MHYSALVKDYRARERKIFKGKKCGFTYLAANAVKEIYYIFVRYAILSTYVRIPAYTRISPLVYIVNPIPIASFLKVHALHHGLNIIYSSANMLKLSRCIFNDVHIYIDLCRCSFIIIRTEKRTFLIARCVQLQ